jgi:hypothetical protein
MSGSIRIVDMPDIGAVTDTSSFVGERAGSGRFSAVALRNYCLASSGVVTPQEYGAVGDGVHDDLSAINAAIAAVGIAGGSIHFPPGTYAVSGTININVPNVQMQGAGAGNWMYGYQPNRGTTLLYTGATGPLLAFSPPVPGGVPGMPNPQFLWGMAVRDMNLDCNGRANEGLLVSSVCNSEFANLNILTAQDNGIYVATAPTTAAGYSERNNFRNINITLSAAGNGIGLDSVTGTTPGLGYGCAFNFFENIQVTHMNGTAYVIVCGDDNVFINCSSSRGSGGTGYGVVFNGTSDGSLKNAQNNTFIWGCFAGTPVGTAAPIRALGGTTPSINNKIQVSMMDGAPTITIDPGATLYYDAIGSYVAGAVPQVLQPGLQSLDATYGSLTNPTRLRILGGQNNADVQISVMGGTVSGGGANATLPQFTVPLLPWPVTFAQLPVMHVQNSGCMVFCMNGRKPGEAAGAGTGVLVFWSSAQWISVCSGTAVTA